MPFLVEKYGASVDAGTLTCTATAISGATIASGSHGCRGMAIVPCSMKTLAGVAHGLSRNLVERAADVMLKERRPLVIVPRETPMSLPQLRNMVLCAEAGAMILPAMPAFYQLPKTLDDLADFMAGKILSALGFEHDLYPPWTGQVGAVHGPGPTRLDQRCRTISPRSPDRIAGHVRRDRAAVRFPQSPPERRHRSALAAAGDPVAAADGERARARPVHRHRGSGDCGAHGAPAGRRAWSASTSRGAMLRVGREKLRRGALDGRRRARPWRRDPRSRSPTGRWTW